jgi:hypothetical protein
MSSRSSSSSVPRIRWAYGGRRLLNRFELISVQAWRDKARVEVWCHDVPSVSLHGLVLAAGGHLPARKTAEMASGDRAVNRTDDRARSVPPRSAAKSLLVVRARARVGHGIARPSPCASYARAIRVAMPRRPSPINVIFGETRPSAAVGPDRAVVASYEILPAGRLK